MKPRISTILLVAIASAVHGGSAIAEGPAFRTASVPAPIDPVYDEEFGAIEDTTSGALGSRAVSGQDRRTTGALSERSDVGIQQHFDAAEGDLRMALRKRRQAGTPRNASYARDLRYMAALYRAQYKYPEAEAFIRWALDILEAEEGPFSLEVASDLIFLADLCFDEGRYDEAETYYKQALVVREKILGSDHPAVAEGLDHYAILLRKTGFWKQAEGIEARARLIRAQHQSLLDAD